MAVVFLARDLKHDRQVALKMLRPEVGAAIGRERLEREILVTARLQHPHILPLHDSGETDGRLYYVMPYVAGESLRARLTRESTLPVEEAVRLTREVADALDHAHAHGVVHRDIKTENILLADGHAVVADFGIARTVAAAVGETLTGLGIALGTPAYMSPEQAAGDADVDGRSDIYSLACVVYEMLAGRPPWIAATTQALLARRFTEEPASLRPLRPDVAAPIDRAGRRAPPRAARPAAPHARPHRRPARRGAVPAGARQLRAGCRCRPGRRTIAGRLCTPDPRGHESREAAYSRGARVFRRATRRSQSHGGVRTGGARAANRASGGAVRAACARGAFRSAARRRDFGDHRPDLRAPRRTAACDRARCGAGPPALAGGDPYPPRPPARAAHRRRTRPPRAAPDASRGHRRERRALCASRAQGLAASGRLLRWLYARRSGGRVGRERNGYARYHRPAR